MSRPPAQPPVSLPHEIPDRLRAQIASLQGEPHLWRVTVRIPPVEPLDWLQQFPDELRFYGSTRDAERAIEIGGVGVADALVWPEPAPYAAILQTLQRKLNASVPGLRYYGGFRFSPDAPPDADWRCFGYSRFIVPRWELVHSLAGTLLSLHFSDAERVSGEAESWLDRLSPMSFAPAVWSKEVAPPTGRSENPDYSGWEHSVERALNDFAAGHLQKIVLARKADFSFDRHLDPIALLNRLKRATPECFHFCYMPVTDSAFIGASPERLYYREDRQLQTEAVAGTRMRSRDPVEDERLGAALLASEKDQHEHALVREGLCEALTPLCTSFAMDPTPRLLRLARGQHLYSRVSGTLRPQISDAALLDALHPTPALGGYPRAPALQRIAAWENFDRGWYAAPVGWISRDAAEFAVAIRSGLVQPKKLSLFSGAGIVDGSAPEKEWEEIELKIRDFIKVLTNV
jgi:menaquinone-specific isochorismate synthase